MPTTTKPKKLTEKQKEAIRLQNHRKHLARLKSGEICYPAPEVWIPDEEQAARTALLQVLTTVVQAA